MSFDEMLELITELIDNKEYAKLRETLSDMNEADIAEILEDIPVEKTVRIFRLLPKAAAAEIFSLMSIEREQEVINLLSDKEAATIIDNLYADDAADLVEEMPANVVKRILAQTDPETRRDINHLLKYPDDSAGSVMTVEFIDVKDNYTVGDAIKTIKRQGLDSEVVDTAYVLDNERKLVGTVTLRSLILNEEDTPITEIMDDNVISVNTLEDQEVVAMEFTKYDLTVMPVVDMEDRLVGIITIDDVVDIIQEEATEDIKKMAAILPSEKTYFNTGVLDTFKGRIPWLLILMISATFTGKIIQSFETALAAHVILTSFIPMLMDTGGNAGSQASVTVIRALSLGEIEYRDAFRVLWKEARVGILTGVVLATANFAKIMLVDQVDLPVAITVCVTVCFVVCLAKLLGCILPIIVKRVGLDPAVMASALLTTILDALSLLMFFTIARIILHF